MSSNSTRMPVRNYVITVLVVGIGASVQQLYLHPYSLFGFIGLVLSTGLLALAIYNTWQKKHTLLRNYPIIGYARYALEMVRPEMRQYFIESDLDGKPFNRRQRSLVYQRAKNVKQTVAFGMQDDPNRPGYEWVAHSINPVRLNPEELRVSIGNRQCRQPYSASILNIGAMSYGALSKTAIADLNAGAELGGFAHNTGEGGISPYHLEGGDLIWQIGTGYFGCRNENGLFCEQKFQAQATRPKVKMIELKLSQGAKPGHGGILPAAKNTPEIAEIRGVEPHTTVDSPPSHSTFQCRDQMLFFLDRLRQLSNGKPVGFKLCIGSKAEFIEICEAIVATGIIPDFITVDGGEGGTGAAPMEFADHVGMPLHDALAFVSSQLRYYNLEKDIIVIASGKIITGFDILKTFALGARACYSSRGMMLSLGCIQALVCDSGHCPVGIATQDPKRYKGIEVSNKTARVANFHANTLKATAEIMEACGFNNLYEVTPRSFYRKVDAVTTLSFDEIYFRTPPSLLAINSTTNHFINN